MTGTRILLHFLTKSIRVMDPDHKCIFRMATPISVSVSEFYPWTLRFVAEEGQHYRLEGVLRGPMQYRIKWNGLKVTFIQVNYTFIISKISQRLYELQNIQISSENKMAAIMHFLF